MPKRTVILDRSGGRWSAGLFARRRGKPISPGRRRLSCSYKHADGNNAGETEGQTQIHSTAEISHRSPPDVSFAAAQKSGMVRPVPHMLARLVLARHGARNDLRSRRETHVALCQFATAEVHVLASPMSSVNFSAPENVQGKQ